MRSSAAKAQLASVVRPPNMPKVLAAPLTVIIGNDLGFADTLPKPLSPERLPVVLGLFEAHEGLIEATAMRNGTLRGAYLLLAARALGLDCWPKRRRGSGVLRRNAHLIQLLLRPGLHKPGGGSSPREQVDL